MILLRNKKKANNRDAGSPGGRSIIPRQDFEIYDE